MSALTIHRVEGNRRDPGDLAAIRAFLLRDADFAAYALGDLEPPYAQHAAWTVATRGDDIQALALLYDAIEPPALYVMGDPAALGAVLDVLQAPSRVLLLAPEDARLLLEERYAVAHWSAMLRMRVTAAEFDAPAAAVEIAPLSTADATAMRDLLERAAAHDGRPLDDIAFADDMAGSGFYAGVWEGGTLLAMAGTHLVAPQAGIAALGNVVVAPEARRRGLGLTVSAHVTQTLLAAGYAAVVLNVHRSNTPAVDLYRQLGYSVRCGFLEAVGARTAARSPIAGNAV